MRRALGGWLVRLGQRIARPTITDTTVHFHGGRFSTDTDIHAVIEDLNRQSRVYAQEYLQRRESRGWN